MTTYTEKCSRSMTATSAGVFDRLFATASNWIEIQRLKARLRQERAALASLDESLLKDIGISPEQAVLEARRDDIPAARLPLHGKILC